MNSGVDLLLALVEVQSGPGEQDVQVLLKEHDAKTKESAGRPAPELEVFKRAALILTITWWESYIEGALATAFEQRLKSAKSPADIKGTFETIGNAWLNPGQKGRPRAIDLADWTGERWKTLIANRFQEELDSLHTPNSENIRHLSKRYIGVDVALGWRWPGTSSRRACTRLDRAIRRRGEIVHRARDIYQSGRGIRRREAVNTLALIRRLIKCTSETLSKGIPCTK